MKILEELWYGNIVPNDRDVPKNSRLNKLGELVSDMKIVSFRCLQSRQRKYMKSCGTVSRSCTGSTNARHSA